MYPSLLTIVASLVMIPLGLPGLWVVVVALLTGAVGLKVGVGVALLGALALDLML